eukprot:GGOE01000614.1.p1 GENE.GGOE01000614.1~~GGOE01000614.1.p1  ORF type:complete len:396 (-),score=69.86 GGOE01000614.1:420-1565(-)
MATAPLQKAKKGPRRCVSAVQVGDVIWLGDSAEAQLVTYITDFSATLRELTLQNGSGKVQKSTFNCGFEIAMEEPKTIAELLRCKDPDQVTVSFEYFPPKSDKMVENLMRRIGLMAKAHPMFCDVTWGAGGGTSDLTLDLCTIAQKRYGVNANMHLTCTNMEKEKIDVALEGCKRVGIRNIVALRGDPPAGETEWKAIDTGFACALDLVRYIRNQHGDYFCLTVAGYPEGHPNVIGADGKCSSTAFEGEMAYLKQKVDAGSDLIITQLFFDVSIFLAFAEECKKIGITCPVLPGIMIVTSYAGFKKMTGFCKTWIPADMAAHMEQIKDDEAAVKEYGLQYATEMCRRLIGAGHRHLHFYCLNLEGPTFSVMERLSLKTPAK